MYRYFVLLRNNNLISKISIKTWTLMHGYCMSKGIIIFFSSSCKAYAKMAITGDFRVSSRLSVVAILLSVIADGDNGIF
ncbi:hypothetical protein QVD17_28578 [Tagetes erecta]|uniref:Uncharacterized protein n=1 Tax=Tagetes erecta TaxID=13708 RepID=A0AAD8KE33_TARER|nr:hypothetical protein QVD17_28578 [Tagetes erecta]